MNRLMRGFGVLVVAGMCVSGSDPDSSPPATLKSMLEGFRAGQLKMVEDFERHQLSQAARFQGLMRLAKGLEGVDNGYDLPCADQVQAVRTELGTQWHDSVMSWRTQVHERDEEIGRLKREVARLEALCGHHGGTEPTEPPQRDDDGNDGGDNSDAFVFVPATNGDGDGDGHDDDDDGGDGNGTANSVKDGSDADNAQSCSSTQAGATGGSISPDWMVGEGQQAPSSSSSSSSRYLPDDMCAAAEYGRQEAVRAEFVHAWRGYEQFAWGQDDLKPVSQQGAPSYGMGLTLVDALDTMILMGLEEEYRRAREWVRASLSFGEQEDINLFETTIRVVGGLLSAWALKNETLFLDKAEELAEKMLFAFDSPSGIPYGTLGLSSGSKYNPDWAKGHSTMAEIGTLQLEFRILSQATGNPVFESKANAVVELLEAKATPLYPQFVSPESGELVDTVLTFGARVDSIYEYFLKYHLLALGQEEVRKEDSDDSDDDDRGDDDGVAARERALDMYVDSMVAMETHLLALSSPNRMLLVSERRSDGANVGKMDHLVCFVPGMLALGAWWGVLDDETSQHHMDLAESLIFTCNEFYRQSPTGLAPEIVFFGQDPDSDFGFADSASHSLLRPETVESLFIMWRVTHDQKYREWGWEIFESLRKYARVPGGGYSSLKDVRRTDLGEGAQKWRNWDDSMESFFLAETLKYLYLLFSDDTVLPLDEWVLNTEAHPMPVNMTGLGTRSKGGHRHRNKQGGTPTPRQETAAEVGTPTHTHTRAHAPNGDGEGAQAAQPLQAAAEQRDTEGERNGDVSDDGGDETKDEDAAPTGEATKVDGNDDAV